MGLQTTTTNLRACCMTAQPGLTQRADARAMLQEQCPSSCPNYVHTSEASLQDSPPLTFT